MTRSVDSLFFHDNCLICIGRFRWNEENAFRNKDLCSVIEYIESAICPHITNVGDTKKVDLRLLSGGQLSIVVATSRLLQLREAIDSYSREDVERWFTLKREHWARCLRRFRNFIGEYNADVTRCYADWLTLCYEIVTLLSDDWCAAHGIVRGEDIVKAYRVEEIEQFIEAIVANGGATIDDLDSVDHWEMIARVCSRVEKPGEHLVVMHSPEWYVYAKEFGLAHGISLDAFLDRMGLSCPRRSASEVAINIGCIAEMRRGKKGHRWRPVWRTNCLDGLAQRLIVSNDAV